MTERTSYKIKFNEAIKAAKDAIKTTFKTDSPIEKTLKNILQEATKKGGVSPVLRGEIDKAVEGHLSEMHLCGGDKYRSLAKELDKANKIISEINKLSLDGKAEVQDLAQKLGRKVILSDLVQKAAEYGLEKGKEEKINFNINHMDQHFNVDSIPIYTKIISLDLNETEQKDAQEAVQTKITELRELKTKEQAEKARKAEEQRQESQERVNAAKEQQENSTPERRPSFSAPATPAPAPPKVVEKRGRSEGADSPEREAKRVRNHLGDKNLSAEPLQENQKTLASPIAAPTPGIALRSENRFTSR